MDLPRAFPSRDALAAFLAAELAEHAAPGETLAPWRGGAAEARARLAAMDPKAYKATRNHLDGAVTGLSPWIRHGLVGLDAARDRALAKVAPSHAEKLVSELAWRDYYQRVLDRVGHRIWDDLEPWKTGHPAAAYAQRLPAMVEQGTSGLACMDGFARELATTGHLHNHARMWVAAWVVHWLKVRWQAGARWFLRHLLDGDLASNNLSWQWVASTFGAKPYYFNRANLERSTDGRYCAACPAAGRCPFAGSYADLAARLFPHLPAGGPA
jgi:deoxyribodipyrimidine photo-lyase